MAKLAHQKASIFSVMSKMAGECGAINLSQGFPDFESAPRLISLVKKYMDLGYNQYAPMPGVAELRDQIAQKVERLYATKISADEEVTITAGATQAIFTAITALIESNDEVIIMEPAYDCYAPAVTLAGGKCVPVSFDPPEFEWPWEKVEQALSEQTRMIILTNPHNPLGRVMTQKDYQRLSQLVQGRDIFLLIDEVYEHLVYDENQHLSVLAIPELYEKSIVTYSFGKTFHNTGWKVGYCIAPPRITHEVRMVHQFNVFSVNTPVQYGLAEYMSEFDDYRSLNTFFQKKRDLLIAGLEGTVLTPLACEGSYFLLAHYGHYSDQRDLEMAEYFTRKGGVATIPLSPFYSQAYSGKVLRLCFAKKEQTLKAAIDRIRQW